MSETHANWMLDQMAQRLGIESLVSYLNELVLVSDREREAGNLTEPRDTNRRRYYNSLVSDSLTTMLKSAGRTLPPGTLLRYKGSKVVFPGELPTPTPPVTVEPAAVVNPYPSFQVPTQPPTFTPNPVILPMPGIPAAKSPEQIFWDNVRQEIEKLADEYCRMPLTDPRFYGFPLKPIFFGTNGSSFTSLVLGSATFQSGGNVYDLKPLVNGSMIGSDSALLLRDNTGNALTVVKKSHPSLSPGEERWIRPLNVSEGVVIRYFMHQHGGSDVVEGGHCFLVQGNEVKRISRTEYNQICKSRGYSRM